MVLGVPGGDGRVDELTATALLGIEHNVVERAAVVGVDDDRCSPMPFRESD